MLKLYFGGSEVPGWRKLLADNDVTDVALSFVGLSRRVKFSRPWLIADKYPRTQNILLDSGGYTINATPDKYTEEDIEILAEKYRKFVAANIERVELVSELDALKMGPEWIARQRSDFYDELGGKFLPIWHEDYGLTELERLAEKYGRVGVPQTSIGGRDIVGVLTRLSRQGIRIHGVSMTKIHLMETVGFSSVSSTSWLSPAQYGDSQIWTGAELKRYPKAYKDQGRKRHRMYLADEGFDVTAYEAGDVTESLRIAIWSWRKFVEHINSRTKDVVTMRHEPAPDEKTENTPREVGMQSGKKRNNIPTERDGDRTLLPGLTLSQVTRTELGKDGKQIEVTDNIIGVAADAVRQCNSCYIAERCPAYKPSSACAYTIPITLKTQDQLRAAQDALLAMQFQRVAFMRTVEESEGGYVDPNLTKEIDLLNRMLTKRIEGDINEEEITIRARRRGDAQVGTIARLFGREASERVHALEAPISSDDVLSTIVDAEVVRDDESRRT